MKQFTKFAAAAVLFVSATVANAAIITTSATSASPVSAFEVTPNKDFKFTFDFNGSADYVKATDTFTSALLTVNVSDKAGSETFAFFLDGTQFKEYKNIDNGGKKSYPEVLNQSQLAALNKDGSLKFSIGISKGEGSFTVDSTTLVAQIDRKVADPVDVPEPVSIALLGLGLAGIAGMRRKS